MLLWFNIREGVPTVSLERVRLVQFQIPGDGSFTSNHQLSTKVKFLNAPLLSQEVVCDMRKETER